MSFTDQQSLRRCLLLTVLELVKDPEETLRVAAEFERFIIVGTAGVGDGGPDMRVAGLPASQPGKREIGPGPTAASEWRPEDRASPKPPERSGEPRELKRPRWSGEEDSRVTALWADGISVKEIAAHLGRTPASVNGRVRHLALPNRLKRTTTAASPQSSSEAPGAHGSALSPTSMLPKNSALRRGWSKRRRRPANNGDSKAAEEEKASAVARHIERFGTTTAPVTLDTVVTFLRSRDYSIVRRADGTYLLDEREVLSPSDLLKRANVVRDRLGKSPFPDRILLHVDRSDEVMATVA